MVVRYILASALAFVFLILIAFGIVALILTIGVIVGVSLLVAGFEEREPAFVAGGMVILFIAGNIIF